MQERMVLVVIPPLQGHPGMALLVALQRMYPDVAWGLFHGFALFPRVFGHSVRVLDIHPARGCACR